MGANKPKALKGYNGYVRNFFFHGTDPQRTHNFNDDGKNYIGWGQISNYIQYDIGNDDVPYIWSYQEWKYVQRGITQYNIFSFWLVIWPLML